MGMIHKTIIGAEQLDAWIEAGDFTDDGEYIRDLAVVRVLHERMLQTRHLQGAT